MRAAYIVAGLGVLLVLTGCQRTSFGGFPSSNRTAPLAPQPVPGVQTSDLSDPTTTAGDFPVAPQASTQGNTEVAAANALDVTKESMVGNWKTANNGLTCDLFLTLTKFGNGSRGGTRGCVGELTAMRSWNVAGKQVILFDASGNTLASLYKTAENRFDGSTNSGQPVSLTR